MLFIAVVCKGLKWIIDYFTFFSLAEELLADACALKQSSQLTV